MTALLGLQELVNVQGRFHRSVQLTKDWQGRQSLSGYLVTPTVRELITRIIGELGRPGGVRAWSITGPYGTGKSSFALFLSRLLAQELGDHPQAAQLEDVVGGHSAPFLPVLLVGQRAKLKPALLTALAQSLDGVKAELSAEILADLERAAEGSLLPDDLVVRRFEAVAARLKELDYAGLVVIADEFGKFLEHTAQHLGSEDLLVMQSLAETASRSETPFTLITILHTGFAEYLDTVDEVQRAKWQKVQGRFTDVAFQEPPEQLLRLLGEAVDTRFPESLGTAYEREIAKCAEAPALSEARTRLPLAELLPACAPLHPLTAVLLWPLFRGKLGSV